MSNSNIKASLISGDNQSMKSNFDAEFEQEFLRFIFSLYPNKKHIPLSEPIISDKDKDLVLKALDQNMISTYGPQVTEFENKLSEFTGINHAVALINGTAALELSLRVLNIGFGDEVITQAYSYIAVPNAIRYVGAEPVFIDNDSNTFGMSVESLEKTILENYSANQKGLINKQSGKQLKAVIAVYAFGQAFDIKAIKNLCDKYNLKLIEDAAEALGTFIDNKHAGSFGDLGVLSFNGNKICSSGAGGAVICNNPNLIEEIRHLSTTAKVKTESGIDYNQLGYNFRMPNINAALGLSQIDSIQDKLNLKLDLRKRYTGFLKDFDYELIGSEKCNNWINSLVLNSKVEKNRLLKLASENNIQMDSSWVYIPETTLYQNSQHYNISNAKDISERVIQLPGSLDFK